MRAAIALLLVVGFGTTIYAQPYPVQIVTVQPDGGFVDAAAKAVHAEVTKALGEKKYATLFRIEDGAAVQIRIVKSGSYEEDRTTDVLEKGLGTFNRSAQHKRVTVYATTLELVAGSASKQFTGESTWNASQAHRRAVDALAVWVKENAEALQQASVAAR